MMARYVDQVLSSLVPAIEQIAGHIDLGRCESPIERGLLVGLVGRWLVNRRLRFDGWPPSSAVETDYSSTVFIQHVAGDYRLDFAIHVELNEGGERHSQWIAIECDGHDYHNLTREQAQRDRTRDRFLTANGFKILRFTGSEIYRNVVQCAEEIDSLIWRTVCAWREAE